MKKKRESDSKVPSARDNNKNSPEIYEINRSKDSRNLSQRRFLAASTAATGIAFLPEAARK